MQTHVQLLLAAIAMVAGDGFRGAYFNALMAEHCLRADRHVTAAEVQRQRARLTGVKRQALAKGRADDVRAAEKRWADFAARAEFACEPSSAARLKRQIDDLVRLLSR